MKLVPYSQRESFCFCTIASKSSTIDFFVVDFSEVILHKWIHCNVFHQSINVGKESFVKRLAIFMMLGTRLGKNLILIQTMFKLKFYTKNSGLQVSQRMRAESFTL